MDVEQAMQLADGTADVRDFAAWVEAANTLAAEVRRLRGERVALEDVFGAACVVDNANARRASAQVQDRCERTDYESSMGFALDTLRVKIDALRKERITAAEAARRAK